MGLSAKKIKLLRDFVDYACEDCHLIEKSKRKDGKVTSKLEPHRLRRGCVGGRYEFRNLKMLCNFCHKNQHYEEFK